MLVSMLMVATMTNPDPDQPHETRHNPLADAPQPDPLLREGPASRVRLWAVGVGLALVLLLVSYAIFSFSTHTAPEGPENARLPSGSSAEPDTALPTGRGDARVPPAKPAETQGRGEGTAQP